MCLKEGFAALVTVEHFLLRGRMVWWQCNEAGELEYEFVPQLAPVLSRLWQKVSEQWLLGAAVIVNYGCTPPQSCGTGGWKLIFTCQFSLLSGRRAEMFISSWHSPSAAISLYHCSYCSELQGNAEGTVSIIFFLRKLLNSQGFSLNG